MNSICKINSFFYLLIMGIIVFYSSGVSQSSGVYGPAIGADTKADRQLSGRKCAYRFRASTTSTVTGLKWNLRIGPGGYSAGNNGTIQIGFQADNGSGLPNGTYIGSTVTSPWPAQHIGGNDNWIVAETFSGTLPSLTAGKLYHVVWQNINASPAANYCSVNSLYTYSPQGGRPRQPKFPDADVAVLYADPGWALQNGYCPTFDVSYANGKHDGQAYYECMVANYGIISGASMVRENFKVSGGNQDLNKVWVRVSRQSGSGNLHIRLEEGNGSLVDEGDISISGLPIEAISTEGHKGTWVGYTFTKHPRLISGSTYNLVLSCPSGTALSMFPLRANNSNGSAVYDKSLWFYDGSGAAGGAQQGSGSSWSKLYQWSPNDMQFYFETYLLDIVFTSPRDITVSLGMPVGYRITYTKVLTGQATMNVIKKPNWITVTGDSLYGTAPTTMGVDTIVAAASVAGGSKPDTLFLAVTRAFCLTLEAESGTLASPMQVASDPAASKGQCITTPAGTGSTIFPKAEATYSFNAPATLTYYVWLKVLIPTISTSGNYGTFVGFNALPFVKPGVINKVAGQYEWIMASTGFKLTTGANQLNLGHGNEQVRIDQIVITNSPNTQLPLGLSVAGILPGDKKNVTQQKQNLSIRIIPNGSVQFLNGSGMHLSVRDVLGREMWSNHGEKSNVVVWNPENGNSRIRNGVYFVVLQQKDQIVKKVAIKN